MRTLAAVASLLIALVLVGCNNDPASPPDTTPSPTETSSPTEDIPSSSADLTVVPGAIGPAKIGMTVDEAVATGLFDTDVEQAECEGAKLPLAWKKQFKAVDVYLNEANTVSTLGVLGAEGPKTAENVGVGSTVGELIGAYGGDLKPEEGVGYDQVGMFVQEGDLWIGFLIGDAKKLTDTDNDPGLKVTLVEVSKGDKPDLMRDGC